MGSRTLHNQSQRQEERRRSQSSTCDAALEASCVAAQETDAPTENNKESWETMGIITPDMREIVTSAKLAFVATVCADGSPNLSPKGSLLVYDDDHLVFMNMASPTTVANLRREPRLEVNVIDFIRRRGYRFKGTAEIRSADDPVYEWSRQWVLDTHDKPVYPCHEAVLIKVERALPVDSPAYTFGHAKEEDLKQTWAANYGLTDV
ncbi:pyridoxamine 5'-phosphate oxidase family protein [Streptomyces sp. NPDC004074]|uniref:pyridoxamine 5'-phosphate oxidase family protein n=1 Tax=unclassified Streptomyces TaxID=2593676 RepID=UPI0033AD896A